MNELVIREATREDAAALIAYLKQIGGETDNLTFGAEGLPISPEEEEAFVEKVHNDPHSVMYVAVRNGEIVADGSLSGMPRRMAHRAELGISVVKKEWNKGIGSRLMQALIDYAKNCGIGIVNLEVRADNLKAIHLYEKFGFRKIGVSPAYMKIGNESVDCLLMYLDLR